MVKIKYVGRADGGVEIAATGDRVVKGDVVDVPKAVADGLVKGDSDSWERAPAEPKGDD